MANYQTGTLYASGGDVYNQFMVILEAYMVARGWTTNLLADYSWYYSGSDHTGKRLHAQKTIDGTVRYVNIRSHKGQQIYSRSGLAANSGISAILSTGYTAATETKSITSISSIDGGASIRVNTNDLFAAAGDTVTITGTTDYNGTHTVTAGDTAAGGAGGDWVEINIAYVSNQIGTITGPTRWDYMTGVTGYSDPNDSSTGSIGCSAVDMPEDVFMYFLFSENSGDNIYFISKNSTGFTGFCFGTTSTGNWFLSGPPGNVLSTPSIYNNQLLCWGSRYYGAFALRKKDDSAWWLYPLSGNTNAVLVPSIDYTNTDTFETDSMVQQLLFCSPDNFKGNNPLIPAYINIGNSASGQIQSSAGIIPGIKYVNMKFMSSLTELTFGADVFKLFRLYATDDANDATIGLALLK